MKRFFRTVGGKGLLFAVCILSLCLLAAFSALAAFLLSDTAFYTASEGELYRQYLSRPLRAQGYGLLEDCLLSGRDAGPDWGNALWQVEDEAGRALARSAGAKEEGPWEFRFTYAWDPAREAVRWVSSFADPVPEGLEYYAVAFSLKPGLPETDELALIARLVHAARVLRYWVYLAVLLALGLSVLSFAALMCAAARRPDSEELHPGPLYRVPFDLLLALCAAGFLLLCLVADELTALDLFTAAAVVLLCFLGANLVLGLCMSAAGRIKGRTLLKNTVIALCLRGLWRLLRWLGRLLGSVTLVWKLALGFVGLSLVELLFIAMFWPDLGPWSVFWCVEKLVLFPLLLALALQLRRLQKGAEALAAGDLGYQTDTGHMLPPLRAHGENLNSIAGGMAAAVEKQLKSERMKTELITNVSHDLKTPLTSVVNYAELIGNEAPGSEKTGEYAKVLLRQAEISRDERDHLEAEAAAFIDLAVRCDDGRLILDTAEIAGLPSAVARRAVRDIIAVVKDADGSTPYGGRKDIEQSAVDRVLRLLARGRKGSKAECGRGVTVRLSHSGAVFSVERRAETPEERGADRESGTADYSVRTLDAAEFGARRETDGFKADDRTVFFDKVKYLSIINRYGNTAPVLRRALSGDRVRPFGMRGEKTVQKLFIDRKIPREQRAELPVLAVGSEVLWIPGICSSELTRIDGGTAEAIEITLGPDEQR